MGGISLKNFRAFRNLCGEQTLRNVVIVTNMWGDVTPQLGEQRERELATKDEFFKPGLDKGAKMMRHNNVLGSAQEIIRHLLKNNPMALQIQREIVDEHKDVSQTAAAAEIERELRAEREKQRIEAERVKLQMEGTSACGSPNRACMLIGSAEGARAQEAQLRLQREEEARRRQAELNRIAAEQRWAQEQRERERREMEQRAREQAEARQREADRIHREHQEQLERERRVAEEARMRAAKEARRQQEEVQRLISQQQQGRRKKRRWYRF